MGTRGIAVGLQIGTQPPLGAVRAAVAYARLMRLDSVLAIDHFANMFPTAIWDTEFSWLAAQSRTPNEIFDYQVLLGYLASRAGGLRIGVGVTEPIRRHPVLIAQAMVTLSHLTRRAPILGIGAGERMNLDPYGLDFSAPVSRLEEALQVIRLCLSSRGPISFAGRHYVLDGALMDLKAPPGRTPEIWVAAHGPRMLRLTGQYGDGWYPTTILSPEEYETKWRTVSAAARKAGRDPDAITPTLHRFLVVASTEEKVREMLRTKALRALGLGAPAELWRRAGVQHPFGDNFNPLVDFVPERYDRATMDNAIAAVPTTVMTEGPLLWGTPGQVVTRLREFQDAGLQHVVLSPLSGLISRRAALYALNATGRIAAALRERGRGPAR